MSSSVSTVVADRMNVKDAAAYLGIGVSTLDTWRSKGKGPAYVRLGGRVFYRRSDLDAYVESAVRETTDSRRLAG